MEKSKIKINDHVAWTTMFGKTMCGFVTFIGYSVVFVKAPNGQVSICPSRLRPATYEDTLAMSSYFASMGS